MDYGQLIRDAWVTTWQHRFLWVLGLFAGAGVSTCSGVGNQAQYRMPAGQLPAGGIGAVPPELATTASAAGAWSLAHLGLLAASATLLVIAWTVVSLVAQGGMTEATLDLARHRPASLRRAWRVGWHLFWRFLGLALVPLALTLGAVLVIGIGAALAFLTVGLAGGARAPVIGLWLLLALVASLAVVGLAIAVSIALAYAQRVVVAEDVGVVAAAREGWRVLRAHLGASVVAWLINLGLTIGAELAISLVMAVVVGVLVALGLAVYSLAGLTVATGLYVALGIAVASALFSGMEAIVNTFLWSYWTLAYLRLTGAPADVRE